MADLAVLGIQIESTEAEVADKRLDDFAASAAKAERATDALAGGSIRADGAIGRMIASIEVGVRDLVAMGQAQLIMAQHAGQAASATNGLATATDRLKSETTGAGAAVKQLDSHMDAYRQSLAATAVAANVANDNIGRVGGAMGKARDNSKTLTQATLNLSRQFSDIGVTAAMGMNPLMILIQQGPQIADVFQNAATQGLGFRAVLAGVGAQIAPVLAFLAPVALAVGVVAGAFALFHRELSKEYPKNITDGMNLTEEQMKRVTKTTVGFGDTLSATFKVVGDRIMNGPIGEGLDWLGQKFTQIMDFTANVVFEAAARIYGVFAGTYQTIIENWRQFPAVLGDLAITAVNYLIRAFNNLPTLIGGIVNRVIAFFGAAWSGIVAGAQSLPGALASAFSRAFRGAIDIARSAVAAIANSLRTMSTAALDMFRGAAERAPEVGAAIAAGVQRGLSGAPVISIGGMIPELENQFAGAAQTVGTAFVTNIQAKTEEARTAMRDLGRDIATQAVANARAAALAQAGDPEAGASGASGRERQKKDVEEIETLWRNVNIQIRETGVRLDEVMDPLELITRELRLVDDLVNRAGGGLAESFGQAGAALADITSGLSNYRVQIDAINKAEREGDLNATQAARERAAQQVQSYGDILGAAKGLFAEQTAAYKLLQAAEQTYRAFQFAMSVKALLMKGAETSATVVGAGIETAAVVGAEGVKTGATLAGAAVRIPTKLAEGAASMFAALGPFGFIAVGAMFAAMAAIGFSGRGGGGGSAPVLPTTNTGTGTVLGNGSDPSESLARSLDMSERYWNKDLDYSNKMVSSLKAIQTNIGSLTTAIAREMNIGGGLDPSGLNRGPTTSGGFLGIGRTTTSSNVVGSGVDLGSGDLADLITRGVTGALYQITQTTRTTSGFLGIGGGTRTTNNESRTGLDAGLSAEFSRVLASLRTGVLSAAGQLGVTGAEAVLDTLQITLGRISFDGMNSAEINSALNAVFSAAGDDMARAILPGLEAFQQAGEGLLETLTRLATGYQVVDQVMTLLGKTFGPVGVGSIEARERLIALAGGLEAFAESADFFAENFLTEAQRIAPVQAAVSAELERLGLATNITRTQFADLVMGLDVSTEGGAAMYAALMRLAPALDQVITYTEETTGVIGNATDLARERRELELRLLEAQGRISEALAARRADELAAMDASLRPLQEAIWAHEDMAAAAQELARTETATADQIRAVARERRAMEIELLDAQGRASEVLAARRQDELDALDATLRPLQLAIYAAQDLAEAQRALAAAQDAATEAAEAAAEAARQLATQRRSLEIDLLEAQGNSIEAVARRREMELEALDASLRPLQLAIYAQLDLNAAQEAAAEASRLAAERAQQGVDAYNEALERGNAAATKAAEEQAAALRETQQRFSAFAKSLADFRRSLDAGDALSGASYAAARREFERVGALAALGNEEALGDLQGVSQSYLDASLDYNSTSLGYLSDLSAVKIAVSKAQATAERTASNADLQLDAINRGVSMMQQLNQSMLLVRDAITGRTSTAGGGASAQAEADATNIRLTMAWHDVVNRAIRMGQAIPDENEWRRGILAAEQAIAATGVRPLSVNGSGSAGTATEYQAPTLSAAEYQAQQAMLQQTNAWHQAISASLRAGQGYPDEASWRAQYQAGLAQPGPMAAAELTMPQTVPSRPDDGGMTSVEVSQLKMKMADLETAMLQVVVNTGQSARAAISQGIDGVFVRGVDPTSPIVTEAA